MIYDISGEFDEMVQQFLREKGVQFEVSENPFLMWVQTGLCQAVYEICEGFRDEGEESYFSDLYAKVPELAKAIERKDMEDISYGRDKEPLQVSAQIEEAYFREIIEKELEKLKAL